MRYCPVILYLGVLDGNFVQEMKLAGVRRYAAARGWDENLLIGECAEQFAAGRHAQRFRLVAVD